MIQNILMLLATDHPVKSPDAQATLIKPPASSSPVGTKNNRSQKQAVSHIGFMVSVAGNAVGFAGLMAGCWLSLQVLQTYL